MIKQLSRWGAILAFLVFGSCEKPIDFTPNNPEAKLVVEATIETGEYPVVYLTRSLDFFNKLDPSDLQGSFVHNAIVKISNGEKTHQLKEKEEVLDGVSFFYYAIDSSNLSTAFMGKTETEYSLEIDVDGEKYTATTTIPALTKTIEKLYYEENIDKEDSGKVALYGEFYDPSGFGNYTRYFTSTNNYPFLPGLNSVFDDQVVDGQVYDLQIEQGVDRNSDIDFEEYSFFRKGDDITVKFCNIDKGVYDFWRTMEYTYQSIGNPFSTPTKVLGNISNGALGYFGGYAVQYVRITIPE
ncbi:MAG: DUF4249 domain-containing protein [Chitinophagaceae bacterium]|nr:DUF4249 domain-containing protein [Chitinophagaceae bacterium]